MIQVQLTRLSSSHQNLRTPEIIGEIARLPQVGEPLLLVGAPLDPEANVRLIETTPITEIRLHTEEGSLEFWTCNSHYGLQILDMDEVGTA